MGWFRKPSAPRFSTPPPISTLKFNSSSLPSPTRETSLDECLSFFDLQPYAYSDGATSVADLVSLDTARTRRISHTPPYPDALQSEEAVLEETTPQATPRALSPVSLHNVETPFQGVGPAGMSDGTNELFFSARDLGVGSKVATSRPDSNKRDSAVSLLAMLFESRSDPPNGALRKHSPVAFNDGHSCPHASLALQQSWAFPRRSVTYQTAQGPTLNADASKRFPSDGLELTKAPSSRTALTELSSTPCAAVLAPLSATSPILPPVPLPCYSTSITDFASHPVVQNLEEQSSFIAGGDGYRSARASFSGDGIAPAKVRHAPRPQLPRSKNAESRSRERLSMSETFSRPDTPPPMDIPQLSGYTGPPSIYTTPRNSCLDLSESPSRADSPASSSSASRRHSIAFSGHSYVKPDHSAYWHNTANTFGWPIGFVTSQCSTPAADMPSVFSMQTRCSAVSPDMPPIPEVVSSDGPMSMSGPTSTSNPAVSPAANRVEVVPTLANSSTKPENEKPSSQITWRERKTKTELKAQHRAERKKQKIKHNGKYPKRPDAHIHTHTHRAIRSARRIFIRKPFLKLVLGRRLGSAAKDGLKTLADVEGDPLVTVEIVERSAPCSSKEGTHITVVVSPACSGDTSVGHQCGDGSGEGQKCAIAAVVERKGEVSSVVGKGTMGRLAVN